MPEDKLLSSYTRQDLINLTQSETLAEELFESLSWQQPENLWSEWCDDSNNNDYWIWAQWAYEKVYLPEFRRNGQVPADKFNFFENDWTNTVYRKYCLNRLEEIRTGKKIMEKTFEYGGYHFTPERQLTRKESSLSSISKRQRIDTELGFCKKGYAYESKFDYSYDGFYNAATEKDFDLFRCEENGKLYIPCANDLQEYVEQSEQSNRDINETIRKSVADEFAVYKAREIARGAEAVFGNHYEIHFYNRVADYFDNGDFQFYEKTEIKKLAQSGENVLERLWDYYSESEETSVVETYYDIFQVIRSFNGFCDMQKTEYGEME